MQCHECGRDVAPDDRFCTGCGTSLRGVTDATEAVAATTAGEQRTELLEVVEDAAEPWDVVDPVWAPTAPMPQQPVSTSQLPATEPVTEVSSAARATAPASARQPYDFVGDEPTREGPATTATMPAVAGAPGARRRFRFGPVMMLALLTSVVALVSLFADVLSITSSARLTLGEETPVGFRTGRWIADDLADNLSIAGLIAIVCLVAGGMATAVGWRWGSGLAGGAGLALAGLGTLTLGLAQVPIDAAHEFAAIPSDLPFTLSITRDIGYWLLLVAAALGIVVFFASINDAGRDGRSGLNPWFAALGALAGLVAAGGPLVPVGRAEFSDNWYLSDDPGSPPSLLLAARLTQLGLLALASLIGFLSVRRWGLGVAAGASLPAVWLAVSALFTLTDRPVGPGYRNPGATDADLHGVTIIGFSALVGMLLLAAVSAYDQWVRERV